MTPRTLRRRIRLAWEGLRGRDDPQALPVLPGAVELGTVHRRCGYCGYTLAMPVIRGTAGPAIDAGLDRVMGLHWQRCSAAPLEARQP